MILKSFFCGFFFFGTMASIGDDGEIQKEENATDAFDSVQIQILNKVSSKKNIYDIPLGENLILGDIRIEPKKCYRKEDSFYGLTFEVPVVIYLEQDVDEDQEDIVLYSDILSTNPRNTSAPLEHPLYDISLLKCQ